ncbi:hypothetical protein BDY19DRAFT_246919 [Irpex rosettiformis]|uniref:Uncharacterized protein n=1 Tax=Irpex rosettiformis TaxID=378272 RepID=A0ACB8TZ30_9APHY|nr:hypothetical protein BDY19DRAFT_246919 [Irpex rosettiformis]
MLSLLLMTTSINFIHCSTDLYQLCTQGSSVVPCPLFPSYYHPQQSRGLLAFAMAPIAITNATVTPAPEMQVFDAIVDEEETPGEALALSHLSTRTQTQSTLHHRPHLRPLHSNQRPSKGFSCC